MSDPSPSPHAGVTLWPALILLVAVLAATTTDSFWIDECVTGKFVSHASLIETWREVIDAKYSEVQMPFFITYIWAFGKVFGRTEFALRLAALPFFLTGMTLLVNATARRWRHCWPMLAAIGLSPFAWYYLNEARPYAMQMGAAAMILAALIRLSETSAPTGKTESQWLWVFLAGLVLLSGLSMLGEIWAGAALLAVFVVVPKERWLGWWHGHRVALMATTALLLALGFYYLWSLTIGARATAVGTTNLQTMLFIFYEQLGFTGVGPGRFELRTAGVQALKPFAAGLGAYAVFTGAVLLSALAALTQKPVRRQTLGILACLAVPAGLILVAGLATHFRVLGRHFAPLAVIVCLVLGAGLLRLWQRRGWIGKGLVAGFVLVTLASCLLLRFAPRHEKDNYRQAAVVARAALAKGETVWWNAGDLAAEYYAVPLVTDGTNRSAALFIVNPAPGFAAGWPKPGTVITSKPDVYDPQGGLAAYLKENNYGLGASFMAFTVWTAPEPATTHP